MPKDKSKPRPGSDIASSLSELGARLIHYVQAGYPGLYLVSPEEQRVEAELKSVTEHLNRDHKASEQYQLCYWSVVDGLVNTETKQVHSTNDPLEVLQAMGEQPERTIILLKDYHLFLQDPNPILVRKLKDVLLEAKTKQKTLIIVGCRLVLPPELEREITVVEFALPGKEALRHVLDGILESAKITDLAVEQQEKAVEAASGLTTIEAENAFALSYVQTRTIEASVVAREKAQAVKKSGLLEIIEARESLDSIGGLDVLKDWLVKRRNAFTQRAVDYGLPPAKGLLIIGIAGTGKSLSAKVAARVFGVARREGGRQLQIQQLQARKLGQLVEVAADGGEQRRQQLPADRFHCGQAPTSCACMAQTFTRGSFRLLAGGDSSTAAKRTAKCATRALRPARAGTWTPTWPATDCRGNHSQTRS